MFFPIRTDRRLQHTPWMNYSLIAANVIIFLLTRNQIGALNMAHRSGEYLSYDALIEQFPVYDYYLQPVYTSLHQFITSALLHADAWHLLGNMLFLYVFGNSVEDRLGKLGYLSFYLLGAVLSGMGHVLFEDAPALGASGAVAAVSGAYLALFPMTNVTIVYFFILIGAFEVSSMILILFYIGYNVFMYIVGAGGVAYLAHLSGYALGFAVGMGLLKTRLLPREPYDLLSMIEHRRRRAQFASLTRRGYQPWDSDKAGPPPPADTGDENGATRRPPLDPQQQKIMDLRARISAAVNDHHMDEAAQLYTQIIELDGGQVMSAVHQRDIANQLMQEGKHEVAARAYELLLNSYPRLPGREDVQLILGLIYTRYLGRRQRARELLAAARDRLSDDEHKDLAKKLLAEIEAG